MPRRLQRLFHEIVFQYSYTGSASFYGVLFLPEDKVGTESFVDEREEILENIFGWMTSLLPCTQGPAWLADGLMETANSSDKVCSLQNLSTTK